MKEQVYFQHRQERERLSVQVKVLQQQLLEQQLSEETGEETKQNLLWTEVVFKSNLFIYMTERKALCDIKDQLDAQGRSHDLVG